VKKILVVEDETRIAQLVRDYLEHAGFEAIVAGDGEAALADARRAKPDLVVLDLGLPGRDGLDVARSLRRTSSVPIVMLTARGDETDRIVGLELGADDYVVKPFSPRELVARVRSVLRRTHAADDPATARQARLRAGDLMIDPTTREVEVAGRPVSLTAREFALLEFLARHPRQVLTRGQLLQQVWEYTWLGDTSTVTVHIRRLREKVEDNPSDPRRVQTVYGVGYRFVPQEPRP
jgi:DNA-binding response OmpR family regulator